MPSPAQAEHIRTFLLIVLGIMIVTIPVICLMVVAKVQAQRRQQRPPGPPAAESGNPEGKPAAGAPDPQGHE